MIYYRLLLVVSTISFLARSAVATRDAGSLARRLKKSKSSKDDPPPTSSPTKSPSESPTESPTESPSASPSTVPTEAATDPPTPAPTATPTAGPSASPTETPNFKKVFFSSQTVSFSDSIDAFNEAVADQNVNFIDEKPCKDTECVSNGHDPTCSRDSFSLNFLSNSNGKIQRVKGEATFSFDNSSTKDCCLNPTCVGKYAESTSFEADSKILFSIEAAKAVILPKKGSWYELVVALYNADSGDLESSVVYRGKEKDVSKFEGEFTGLANGDYFLRIFPALYSYKGKTELKSKIEIKKLQIANV